MTTDLTQEQIEALLKRLDLVEAITENAEWGAIAMFDVAQIITLLRGLKINNTREKDDHELSLAEIEAGADLAEHHRRALQAPQFQPAEEVAKEVVWNKAINMCHFYVSDAFHDGRKADDILNIIERLKRQVKPTLMGMDVKVSDGLSGNEFFIQPAEEVRFKIDLGVPFYLVEMKPSEPERYHIHSCFGSSAENALARQVSTLQSKLDQRELKME